MGQLIPQKIDLYYETYEALERLKLHNPDDEYLQHLTDFGYSWKDDDTEQAFLERYRPAPDAGIDDAIVEFLALVEDKILYDFGAPEWSHQSAPLLLKQDA